MTTTNTRFEQERAIVRCIRLDYEAELARRYRGGIQAWWRRLQEGEVDPVWVSAGQQMLAAWLPMRRLTVDFVDVTTDEVLVLDRRFAVYIVKREISHACWMQSRFLPHGKRKKAPKGLIP